MTTNKLPSLIGVIHLPPLAGAPAAADKHPSQWLDEAGMAAIKEAKLLEQAGFEGLMLENFGDRPFYKNRVPPETTASLAVIAAVVTQSTKLPVGVNVLRNDAPSALAIAAVTGCEFIRVNLLSGVAVTDQGLIEGEAAFLLRERSRLQAQSVRVLADALVKHSEPLSSKQMALAIEDLALRALADAVLVTGPSTGRSVDDEALRVAYKTSRECAIPLFLGSGVNAENLSRLKPLSDGIVVSSALRKAGRAGNPLDPKRIQEFMRAYRACKSKSRSKKSPSKGDIRA